MPGTTERGGRPRSLEAILRDASMANRLVLEQLQGASGSLMDISSQMAAINLERRRHQAEIDAAIAQLARERVGWDGVERRRACVAAPEAVTTSLPMAA
jgi:hypothetical protein